MDYPDPPSQLQPSAAKPDRLPAEFGQPDRASPLRSTPKHHRRTPAVNQRPALRRVRVAIRNARFGKEPRSEPPRLRRLPVGSIRAGDHRQTWTRQHRYWPWCGAARWGPRGRWSFTSSTAPRRPERSWTGSARAYPSRNRCPTRWPASCWPNADCSCSAIRPLARVLIVGTALATCARNAELINRRTDVQGTFPLNNIPRVRSPGVAHDDHQLK